MLTKKLPTVYGYLVGDYMEKILKIRFIQGYFLHLAPILVLGDV